jgi:hypothetical protein
VGVMVGVDVTGVGSAGKLASRGYGSFESFNPSSSVLICVNQCLFNSQTQIYTDFLAPKNRVNL